eukprot:8046079-Ditylum_brightwellii.AAC.1
MKDTNTGKSDSDDYDDATTTDDEHSVDLLLDVKSPPIKKKRIAPTKVAVPSPSLDDGDDEIETEQTNRSKSLLEYDDDNDEKEKETEEKKSLDLLAGDDE